MSLFYESFCTHWVPVFAYFLSKILMCLILCIHSDLSGTLHITCLRCCGIIVKHPIFWALEVIWFSRSHRKKCGYDPDSPWGQTFLFNNWRKKISKYSQIIFMHICSLANPFTFPFPVPSFVPKLFKKKQIIIITTEKLNRHIHHFTWTLQHSSLRNQSHSRWKISKDLEYLNKKWLPTWCNWHL